MREREVEAYLVKRVEELGGIAYKFTSPNRVNVPDRLVLLPEGQIFFVECKAPGKRLTAAQSREFERITELGQRTFLVDNKELIDRLLVFILGRNL